MCLPALLHRAARYAATSLVAAALVLGVLTPAWGQEPDGRRALLTLSVNEVDKQEALVVIRGADILIAVSTLESAGLRHFQGRRETIDGAAWVSLASLSPAITFRLDERALALSVTASPEFLARAVLDLRPPRPAAEYARATSAFLNYGLNWAEASGASASFETGLSVGPAVALSTVSYVPTLGWGRGLTNVTYDRRDRLQRWRLGDSVVGARSLGSGLVLAGVHVSRDTSLDPYFVQFPTLALSGAALTPSTVDVYVNDRLVSRQQVSPGTFQLSNVPMTTGGNQARVVVRDAFGREQEMAAGYYLTTSVLARGLHDYGYAVGVPRQSSPGVAWEYGRLSFSARHRYGLTDTLTLGASAEGDNRLLAGGPSLNLRLPMGEVEVATMLSSGEAGGGAAGFLGISSSLRGFSVGATLRAMSRSYRSLGFAPSRERPRVEANAILGVHLGHGVSVNVQHAYSSRYEGPEVSRSSVSTSLQVAPRASVFLTAGRAAQNRQRGVEVFAGLTLSPANRTSTSLWAQRQGGRQSLSAEVQRSLPMGEGFGYRLRTEDGVRRVMQGVLQAQTTYGRYEAGHEVIDGRQTARAAVSGGLVAIGGGVHAAREVSDSYALVRVPDVPDVRAFANNQEIGRTGRGGDILVPNLLPYYANRLSIADQDVPLDHALSSVERVVAPPYRGGAVVLFPAVKLRPVRGTIVLDEGGQTVLPVLGQLTVFVGEAVIESPIGRQGEFYFDTLAPGRYPAVVQFRATSCQFHLEVPSVAGSSETLGVLRCQVRHP